MHVIHTPLPEPPATSETTVAVTVERRNFSKLRWRAIAEDNTEFGFDLQHSLAPGMVVHRSTDGSGKCYILEQAAEPVIEIPYPSNQQHIISLVWQIGNLHFPLQVHDSGVRTVDDSAIRQMLDRQKIHYHPANAVFQPLAAVGHGHGHHHSHDH